MANFGECKVKSLGNVTMLWGRRDGEGLLQCVPHVEAQLEILLHVLQQLVYVVSAWGGGYISSSSSSYVYFIGTC